MKKKYTHAHFNFGKQQQNIFRKGTFARKLFVKLTQGHLDPLISCTQILKYEPENRSNEDLEKTFPWLMKMNDLYEFLTLCEESKDHKAVLTEFALILFNTITSANQIIKRVGEKKDHFILVMSGSVDVLEFLFKRYNLIYNYHALIFLYFLQQMA